MKPVVAGENSLKIGMTQHQNHSQVSSGNQNSEPRLEIHDFLIQTSSLSVRSSTETLRDEIKAIVTKEQDFEYRDETKLLALSECSEHERSDARIKIVVVSIELSSSPKIVNVGMNP